MLSLHIKLIMDIIDSIIPPDERKRKYTDRQIMKVLVLLQIFNLSYRSSRAFLMSHGEYIKMIGLREIPSFQTLSRSARSLDPHEINSKIASLYSYSYISAMDSFMIRTCKGSTAERRRRAGNYKDPLSGWSKTTKGWVYGRKCQLGCGFAYRYGMRGDKGQFA